MGIHVAIHEPRKIKCIDEQTDWTALFNPNNLNFSDNLRKLCYVLEYKMNDIQLWPCFQAYLMDKENMVVTGEEIIKNYKGQEVSLRKLFKNKIEGSKKQVRENCQKKYKIHLSSKGNASGGKGQKLSAPRTKEEINERRRLERSLKRSYKYGTFYLYQDKDIMLPFTCDYKEVYMESETRFVYKIGFKSEAWIH